MNVNLLLKISIFNCLNQCSGGCLLGFIHRNATHIHNGTNNKQWNNDATHVNSFKFNARCHTWRMWIENKIHRIFPWWTLNIWSEFHFYNIIRAYHAYANVLHVVDDKWTVTYHRWSFNVRLEIKSCKDHYYNSDNVLTIHLFNRIFGHWNLVIYLHYTYEFKHRTNSIPVSWERCLSLRWKKKRKKNAFVPSHAHTRTYWTHLRIAGVSNSVIELPVYIRGGKLNCVICLRNDWKPNVTAISV